MNWTTVLVSILVLGAAGTLALLHYQNEVEVRNMYERETAEYVQRCKQAQENGESQPKCPNHWSVEMQQVVHAAFNTDVSETTTGEQTDTSKAYESGTGSRSEAEALGPGPWLPIARTRRRERRLVRSPPARRRRRKRRPTERERPTDVMYEVLRTTPAE